MVTRPPGPPRGGWPEESPLDCENSEKNTQGACGGRFSRLLRRTDAISVGPRAVAPHPPLSRITSFLPHECDYSSLFVLKALALDRDGPC